MGRLEGGQLVGNGDTDGEEEGHDAATNTRTREFMDALYRGDVTNAGAAENSDALIAALATAYGAPPEQPQQPPHPSALSPPTVVTASTPASATPPPKTAFPVAQKGSRFKRTRAVPPPTVDNDDGLREGGADRMEHGTALSATSPSSAPIHPGGSLPVPVPVPDTQIPPMIVDSPSFAPPPGGRRRDGLGPSPMMTIIDSPSFRKPMPGRPLSLSHPPTVLPLVRESSSGTQRQQETSTPHEPGKKEKVSRFKAQQQRAEP